jgi:hypothetical protein
VAVRSWRFKSSFGHQSVGSRDGITLDALVRAGSRLQVEFDPRSVAAFRVCIGLLAALFAIDFLIAARELPLFELISGQDGGVLMSLPFRLLSPFFWSNEPIWFVFLFLSVFLSGLALAANARMWWLGLILWWLLLSLHHRGFVFLYGADTLFRLSVFWLLFLPTYGGAQHRRAKGWACSALLAQWAFVHLSAGWMKNFDLWFVQGAGVQQAFMNPVFRGDFAPWALAVFPDSFFSFASRATLFLERLGPLVLMLTWRLEKWRCSILLLFAFFHILIFLFLDVGLFPLVNLAILVCFLPSYFWNLMPHLRWNETRKASLAWVLVAKDRLALIFLGLIVVFQVRSFVGEFTNAPKERSLLYKTLASMGLMQHWNLFAPSAGLNSAWVILVIEDERGQRRPWLVGDSPGAQIVSEISKGLHTRWVPLVTKYLARPSQVDLRMRLARAVCEPLESRQSKIVIYRRLNAGEATDWERWPCFKFWKTDEAEPRTDLAE